MNTTIYNAINAMLTASGSSMTELIEFHFEQTGAVEKTAPVEKKEVFKGWKPVPKGARWADLSDDEEDFPLLGAKEEKPAEKPVEKSSGKPEEKPVEKPAEGSFLKVVSRSTVLAVSKPVSAEELKGFIVKTSTRKQELPVVYSVEEFIECIKDRMKPGVDFKIDDSAHCEHTYKGTLCENVRVCGKIHIQRCTRGDECYNKHCSFVHSWDMEDDEAERSFRRTMRKYNMLKSSKQVQFK